MLLDCIGLLLVCRGIGKRHGHLHRPREPQTHSKRRSWNSCDWNLSVSIIGSITTGCDLPILLNQFRVIGVDGSVHEVRYIADDKGFRVLGEGKVDAPAPAPAPVTSAPTGYPAATSPPDVYLPPEDQSFFQVFDN